MWDISREELAQYIDQTNLKPDATEKEMAEFINTSKDFGFKTVAIMPLWVPLATNLLEGSRTSIVSSVGFPLGTCTTESKVTEVQWSIENGLKNLEIDMVMNLSLFKSRRYQEVEADIQAVVRAAEGHTTKVIIEVPLLTDEEIVIASLIAANTGIDYIKTSTGFRGYPEMRPSTAKDVQLIKKTVFDQVKIKIAGGIFSLEQALEVIDEGVSRIGTIAGIPITNALESLPKLAPYNN
jgi:deoxyribose-phosphate aldolase